jgi:hypothetical protein
MNNAEVIKKAGKVIESKANYVGGGMEGYAVLSLMDDEGYPASSTLTIARASGIDWLTFCTSPDSNKAKRAEITPLFEFIVLQISPICNTMIM